MPQKEYEEIKHLLKVNLEVGKENQEILRKLHRASIFGMAARIIWFMVIIGLPVLLFYYVFQPYLETLGLTQEDMKGAAEFFKNFNAFHLPFRE